MKKDSNSNLTARQDNRISELIDLIDQRSLQLKQTQNETKREEILEDIKDLHKEIKRLEMSFFNFKKKNH